MGALAGLISVKGGARILIFLVQYAGLCDRLLPLSLVFANLNPHLL
jgi:hypothetical protein